MVYIIILFTTIVLWFFAVRLLRPAYDTWKRHKEGKQRKYGWFKIIIGGYFGIAFLLSPILMIYSAVNPSSSSTESSSTTETQSHDDYEQKQKDKEKAEQKKEAKAKAKQKKFNAEVNRELKKGLSEDQNFFAKGDKRYNYAPFINSIKYTGEDDTDRARAQVNTNFASLDNESKSIVAEKVQGVIGAALAVVKDDYMQEEQDQGAGLFFYLGKRAVGHSRMLSSHKYKWYNLD
ncbi:hypothetical protein PT285_02910 [Lactobacillus sp. ESL0791]|uniref:hypothetical protein n=1 Tax=Lactobacillus sp. ESL0791 TaxID=2983234 RepID=UPI0023F618AC|nr:hypothetical protein [Lactobacillus sp. ESL0791]MDF7638385.1 hypothetical protein [Lactobacillus sp. ESL0791]